MEISSIIKSKFVLELVTAIVPEIQLLSSFDSFNSFALSILKLTDLLPTLSNEPSIAKENKSPGARGSTNGEGQDNLVWIRYLV